MQVEFNRAHGITPRTIRKPVKEKEVEVKDVRHVPRPEIPNTVIELELRMRLAADRLDFEQAIALREQIRRLQERLKEKAR
jgi:excinuclease ABC subunit B